MLKPPAKQHSQLEQIGMGIRAFTLEEDWRRDNVTLLHSPEYWQ
jgi:hypothetical protein